MGYLLWGIFGLTGMGPVRRRRGQLGCHFFHVPCRPGGINRAREWGWGGGWEAFATRLVQAALILPLRWLSRTHDTPLREAPQQGLRPFPAAVSRKERLMPPAPPHPASWALGAVRGPGQGSAALG